MENDDKPFRVPLIAAVAALGLGAYLYFYHYRPSQAPRPLPELQPSVAVRAPEANPPAPLISLEQTDDLIREKTVLLSSAPLLAAWLKEDRIVWRGAAALNIIAEGNSPQESLSFLRPREDFSIIKKKGRIFMNPRGYKRYDSMANVIESLNVPAVAVLYEQLKPLLESVCGQLGCRDSGFHGTLTAAISELLKTPVVHGDIRLRKKLKCYVMANPKLEQLSEAQKHLIRMGPENTAKIQAKLREMALALGVAEQELPKGN